LLPFFQQIVLINIVCDDVAIGNNILIKQINKMLLNKYLRIRRIVRSAAVYSAGEHSFWRAETQLATEPWSWNRCHQVWHTNWRNI